VPMMPTNTGKGGGPASGAPVVVPPVELAEPVLEPDPEPELVPPDVTALTLPALVPVAGLVPVTEPLPEGFEVPEVPEAAVVPTTVEVQPANRTENSTALESRGIPRTLAPIPVERDLLHQCPREWPCNVYQ
jgi:hypothetical protein